MRNAILAALILLSLSAGAQDKIIKIHLKSGYTALFAVSKVDSVTYGTVLKVHQANGNIASFTTANVERVSYSNDADVVIDIDDNVYQTVVIGTQTWMADNLRVSRYRNGTTIPNLADNTQWTNNTSGAFSYYNNNENNNYPYGKLYNWYAVNNANQLCPAGWHVPTDAEWTTMATYLDEEGYVNAEGEKIDVGGETPWGAVVGAKIMAKTTEANSVATNSSGFSGYLGGLRSSDGTPSNLNFNAYWWSSTQSGDADAIIRYVFLFGPSITHYKSISNKKSGNSVRCVKDLIPAAALTTLDCANATNNGTITQSSAASSVSSVISYTGGNGGTYAAQSISSTGITGLTASLSAGTLASGNGTLTYTITGTPNTSGTASFAISVGGQSCTLTRTVYGSGTVAGITAHTCGSTNVHNSLIPYGTMTDQEGNQYRTIQIGNQTWMAENLRTTKYRNGTNIIPINTNNTLWASNTTGAYCSHNNNTANDCPYGKLYNWYAVNNANQLCPTGWHVPTDAEWTTLITFLGGESVAGGKMKSTGTQYWLINIDADNSSGFSGLPGDSRFNDGLFFSIGYFGYWWSSTESSTTNAWRRSLHYPEGYVYRSNNSPKKSGLSVRCLRD
jgi:uncharacterized protein (TIGR02145 family)